jgi:hypothetical protein
MHPCGLERFPGSRISISIKCSRGKQRRLRHHYTAPFGQGMRLIQVEMLLQSHYFPCVSVWGIVRRRLTKAEEEVSSTTQHISSSSSVASQSSYASHATAGSGSPARKTVSGKTTSSTGSLKSSPQRSPSKQQTSPHSPSSTVSAGIGSVSPGVLHRSKSASAMLSDDEGSTHPRMSVRPSVSMRSRRQRYTVLVCLHVHASNCFIVLSRCVCCVQFRR